MFANIVFLLFTLLAVGTCFKSCSTSDSTEENTENVLMTGSTSHFNSTEENTEKVLVTADGFRSDYKYFPMASGWFKYHNVTSTWKDARLRCQLEGAVLASPLNREMLKVMSHLAGNNLIYTGIHDLFSRFDYFSIEGEPLAKILADSGVIADWADSQNYPDQTPGQCLGVVLLDSYLYFHRMCRGFKPFICYRQDPSRNLTVNECGTIDNEYQLSPETGKCYKFHRTPRTWSRAYLACAAEGGHLAIINSQQEAAVLSKLFKSMPPQEIKNLHRGEGYYAFIGFHDWSEHGDFLTIHGETLQAAGYATWTVGEPNNVTGSHTNYVGEHCGSINRGGQLNDLWCDYVTSFICEKEPNNLQI